MCSAAQAPSADVSAALCVVGLDRSDAAKVTENCKIWDEADSALKRQIKERCRPEDTCHLCTSENSSTAYRKVCVGEAQLKHMQTRKSEGANKVAKGVAKVQAYKAEDLPSRGPAKEAKHSHTPQHAYSGESSSSENTDEFRERRRRERSDKSKCRPSAKKSKAAKARAAESSSGEVNTHRSSQGQERESSGSRPHWRPSYSKPQASSGYQGKSPDSRFFIHHNQNARTPQQQVKKTRSAPSGPSKAAELRQVWTSGSSSLEGNSPPAVERGKAATALAVACAVCQTSADAPSTSECSAGRRSGWCR